MLSKSTEYAIRAMVFIQLQNWKDKRPLIVDIAREIEAPQAFTAKILQNLSRRAMVSSMKGRGGGFFYTDENKDMTVYDVILVMEGNRLFNRCVFGLKNCNSENPCPLHEEYAEVRDKFMQIVQNETIHSLSRKVKDGKAVINRLVDLN